MRYYQELNLELKMLSTTSIDLNDEKLKMGVKNGFYGLNIFNFKAKFYPKFFVLLSVEFSELLQKVC